MRASLFALTWLRRIGAAILVAWALKYSFYDFEQQNPREPNASTGQVREVTMGPSKAPRRYYATPSDAEWYYVCLYGSLFLVFAALK
jgi:hypothetical protein